MTSRDLDSLKNAPVPPPGPDARARAVATAMEVFDQAEENPLAGPQGKVTAGRPIDASSKLERSAWMRRRHAAALAASVAGLGLAVPVAMHLAEQRLEPGGQSAVGAPGQLQGAKGQDSAAVAAPRELQPLAKADGSTTARPGIPGTVIAPLAPPPAAPPQTAIAPPPAPRSEQKLEGGEADRLAGPARKENRSRVADIPRAASAGGDHSPAVATVGHAPGMQPRMLYESGRRQVLLDNRDQHPEAKFRPDPMPQPQAEENRDRFDATAPNPVKKVAEEPVSTFSVDVDTASYAFVRRSLNAGRLPPKDAVRVEEMINYFSYNYPRPESADAPFRPNVSVFPAPWNPDNRLVHVAIKGYELAATQRPRANLVLLIDISGSMMPADRLPLLKNAFKLMLDNLKPDDTVGIVTYASGSGVALAPTKVSERGKIIAAIDALGAGGSTAGARGIHDAYALAEANFDKTAVNRIILGTDGDFNVGITSRDELKGFVERKRQTGIYLSILGVGMGNHNDQLMQALAQNGNGVAAYIDTLNEARKVLVDEASSTLFPIAKDVKIQIEFNPSRVSEYRLIGYETRMLRREDFNNDKVDAGDVGSGHAVTALYEITPAGAKSQLVEDLRYGQPDRARREPAASTTKDAEFGFLKLRYKLPAEETSKLIELPIGPGLEARSLAEANQEARFAAAVAAFGQLLRGLPYMKSYGYDDVIALANAAKGEDAFGYRAELVNLVRLAKSAKP
jgi:Ca-activated chloride channel family protein